MHRHLIHSDPHWYPARQALKLHPSESTLLFMFIWLRPTAIAASFSVFATCYSVVASGTVAGFIKIENFKFKFSSYRAPKQILFASEGFKSCTVLASSLRPSSQVRKTSKTLLGKVKKHEGEPQMWDLSPWDGQKDTVNAMYTENHSTNNSNI